MIFQFHWQKIGSMKTEFVRQFEINDDEESEIKLRALNRIMKEILENEIQPENTIPMVCTEKSEHFLKMPSNMEHPRKG